jgi:hypothetical protein
MQLARNYVMAIPNCTIRRSPLAAREAINGFEIIVLRAPEGG